MLIDEADVYIKRRSDNLASNAVVGVFLRVLKYFNGLLFLTTNRVDDIDEAIISRYIAMIKYQLQNDNYRRQIWQVMTEQFELPLDQALIEQLVELFPGVTGRDIKGLSKLVAKFCQHKQLAPSLKVFKRCSVLRGLESLGGVRNKNNPPQTIIEEDDIQLIDTIIDSGEGMLEDEYPIHWFPGDDLLAVCRPRCLPYISPCLRLLQPDFDSLDAFHSLSNSVEILTTSLFAN